MNNLSTRSKLRAAIIIAVVVVLAMYVVLALAVWGARAEGCENMPILEAVLCLQAANDNPDPGSDLPERIDEVGEGVDCPHGDDWIRIADYLDPEQIRDTWGDGWVFFVNKCGEMWLIPITVPNPEPYPEPYPEP